MYSIWTAALPVSRRRNLPYNISTRCCFICSRRSTESTQCSCSRKSLAGRTPRQQDLRTPHGHCATAVRRAALRCSTGAFAPPPAVVSSVVSRSAHRSSCPAHLRRPGHRAVRAFGNAARPSATRRGLSRRLRLRDARDQPEARPENLADDFLRCAIRFLEKAAHEYLRRGRSAGVPAELERCSTGSTSIRGRYRVGDLVNRGPDNLGPYDSSAAWVTAPVCLTATTCTFSLSRPTAPCDPQGYARSARRAGTGRDRRCLRHPPASRTGLDFTMVHAGLPPIWDSLPALNARGRSRRSSGDAIRRSSAMYGNQPAMWSDHLSGMARARVITNYFTRLLLQGGW